MLKSGMIIVDRYEIIGKISAKTCAVGVPMVLSKAEQVLPRANQSGYHLAVACNCVMCNLRQKAVVE